MATWHIKCALKWWITHTRTAICYQCCFVAVVTVCTTGRGALHEAPPAVVFCLFWSPGFISPCLGPAGSVWPIWVVCWWAGKALWSSGGWMTWPHIPDLHSRAESCSLCPKLQWMSCPARAVTNLVVKDILILHLICRETLRIAAGPKIYAEKATGVQCCWEVFEITF